MHKGGSVAVVAVVVVIVELLLVYGAACVRLFSQIPSCLGSSPAVATRRGRNWQLSMDKKKGEEEADETQAEHTPPSRWLCPSCCSSCLLLLVFSNRFVVLPCSQSLRPRYDPMAIMMMMHLHSLNYVTMHAHSHLVIDLKHTHTHARTQCKDRHNTQCDALR